MVGFPGETEEEFSKTCEFLEKVSFSGAHIFQYSRRKGTPADTFPNQVPETVKSERSKIVERICSASKKEFIGRFPGTTAEVLFEKRDGDFFEGKTGNYINVLVKTDRDLSGQYRKVRILKVKNDALFGELTEEE